MTNPIRSMTGFAPVSKSTGTGEIAVSLKSLNHRGLELHFHHGSEIDPFENAMRAAIKRAVLRGHVDIRVSLAHSQDGAIGLNEEMLGQYMGAFRKAAQLHNLREATPDLNTAF